jgi:hypothetical protein
VTVFLGPRSPAAYQTIEEAAKLPQETGEVPSVRASDPLVWGKRQGRWHGYLYGPGIYEPGPTRKPPHDAAFPLEERASNQKVFVMKSLLGRFS